MTPRSVNTSIHWLRPIQREWDRIHSLSLSLSLRLVLFVSLSLSTHSAVIPIPPTEPRAHRQRCRDTLASGSEWVCACAFTLIYFTEAWETVTHTHTHWNVSASQWDSTCYLHNALCHLLSMPRAQHLLKEGSVKEWMCVCGCVCVCVCVCVWTIKGVQLPGMCLFQCVYNCSRCVQ